MRTGQGLLRPVIAEVWDRLPCIRQLRIMATSNAPAETPWRGRGEGSVNVQVDGATIIFTETGTWHLAKAGDLHFANIYRWSRVQHQIRLEHLRHGPFRPVHLIDLIPSDDPGTSESACQVLIPVRAHRCGDDLYEGVIKIAGDGIKLDWTIQGPQKAAEIHIHYS